MQEYKLHWFKATPSSALNACVELARDREFIALRNSRDRATVLQFTHAEIAAFLRGAKMGEFDHLVDGPN